MKLLWEVPLSVCVLAALLLLMPVGTASNDDIYPPDVDDRPLFTSFSVTPATLAKNRINWVTVTFSFKDDMKNLRGGTFGINFIYTGKSNNFYTFPLVDRVFEKATGNYSLSFGLLAEKWDDVTILAWLQDSNGTSGNDSGYITLKPEGKDPIGGIQGRKPGRTAYEFTLLDQKGQEFSLSKYKGKVVLLDFSTGWCTFCADEAEEHSELLEQYQDQGFEIVTVLTEGVSGNPATPKDCKLWARRFKLSGAILADPFYGVYYAYTGKDKIKVYPYNFIIDRNGVIRWKKSGYKPNGSTRAQMELKIEELLKK
jgi:peroxiredoxin